MIPSRSPYNIEIAEAGQTGSKLELFIWQTGSQPASPQYTLSKLIPATNNIKTYYNISPYVNEYYTFTNWPNLYNTYDADINTNFKVNVVFKRYKRETNGDYTLITPGGTSDIKEFMYGLNYYMETLNTYNNTPFLSEGTYFYNHDSALSSAVIINMAGSFDIDLAATDAIKYTNLSSGATHTVTATADGIKTFSRVYLPYIADGNKVEYLAGGSAVRWTAYFRPQCEPKYSPVAVDFINRYGSWARIFFQKAKTRNINVKAETYKVNPSTLPAYPSSDGQVREFNKNGTESIKLNTGWVNDLYGEYIQELLLSEKVMLYDPEQKDGLFTAVYTPVNVQTKSLLKQRGINKGVINYELTFDFAYDLIQTVV
jgi:hypothetical protein